jgi:hypothetical protein
VKFVRLVNQTLLRRSGAPAESRAVTPIGAQLYACSARGRQKLPRINHFLGLLN